MKKSLECQAKEDQGAAPSSCTQKASKLVASVERVREERKTTRNKTVSGIISNQAILTAFGGKKKKPARFCLMVSTREFWKQTGLWIKI